MNKKPIMCHTPVTPKSRPRYRRYENETFSNLKLSHPVRGNHSFYKSPRHSVMTMSKEDLFKIKPQFKQLYTTLECGTFSKFKSDNEIIKRYIDAKFQGNYRTLIYECNAPEKTLCKNLVTLKKIVRHFNKPLTSLTEDDIIDLQNKLNQNKIYSYHTKKPISHSYKYDIVKNIKQFWKFYRAYCKYEKNENIEDITEYFRLRRECKTNELVKFLTHKEIESMINSTDDIKMKTILKIFFETGGRTIEVLNLRKFNCNYDYENKKWIIKLPNMKGLSTAKMPIEIDYASKEFDTWMKLNNFKPDDYIFDYSYLPFKRKIAKLGMKAIGRRVTSRMFRKSCAMHLVNLDINEQYIKAHMGWSPHSKAIAHYISQKAIKKPDRLINSFCEQSGIQELKDQLKQMETLLLQRLTNGVSNG